jgi:hypothetical protein
MSDMVSGHAVVVIDAAPDAAYCPQASVPGCCPDEGDSAGVLPVGDKPVIEHTVRKLVSRGITDITIVVSRGKSLIQEHFRPNPVLVEQLRADGNTASCRYGRWG